LPFIHYASLLTTFYIFLPFHGEKVFLLVVTFLADGSHVSLGCLAPPNQRNDVIHGQLRGRELSGAIVTNAPSQLLLPPPGLAQNSGLFFFSFNLLCTRLDDKWVWHIRFPWFTSSRRSQSTPLVCRNHHLLEGVRRFTREIRDTEINCRREFYGPI